MCSGCKEGSVEHDFDLKCRNRAKKMGNTDRLKTTFDKVADLYDKARPGYPEQLIEDVLTLSEIPPGGTILEIGCGTGQATQLFAAHGYTMLCLEFGAHLAVLAAKNCRQYHNVTIQNISFEKWAVQEKFDLVISAQAFDWIPPEIGYSKAFESLKDSGSIALFRNDIPDTDTEVSCALDEVHQNIIPHLAEQRKGWDSVAKKTENHIKASGLFKKVITRHYLWSEQYSPQEYINLIRTYSTFHTLDKETQHNLLSGIREAVEHFGGIEVQYVATLSIAKVKR
jgi:SAM-dependent methyltransferase